MPSYLDIKSTRRFIFSCLFCYSLFLFLTEQIFLPCVDINLPWRGYDDIASKEKSNIATAITNVGFNGEILNILN